MPITFFGGRQEWTERDYVVLTSEPYTWNKVGKPA
jgi:hypothetical protein